MSGEHPTYGGYDDGPPFHTTDRDGVPDGDWYYGEADIYDEEAFPCPNCGDECLWDQTRCDGCGELIYDEGDE